MSLILAAAFAAALQAVPIPGSSARQEMPGILLEDLTWVEAEKVLHYQDLLRNMAEVFLGRKSWVGYIPAAAEEHDLPPLKQGVLHPGMLFRGATLPEDRIRQLNVLYAKDYRIRNDAELVLLNLKKLDNHGTD